MATLARKDAPAVAAEPCQYLTFTLGGEMYAVETLSVKEIIEYGQVTTVPMMPPSIRGVINLRGAVVPVIDLQARFGQAPARLGRKSCIVLVEVAPSGVTDVNMPAAELAALGVNTVNPSGGVDPPLAASEST